MFKRVLIASALSAAFAAPAFADVTISGSAEMDLFVRTHQVTSQNNDGGSTAFGNETDLIINFDGKDKLDSGNSLIWHVGQKVQTPGTAAWGSREAYVGIAGEWGSFRSGRMFAPTYLALDEFQWGAGNLWEDYGANAVWFKEAITYATPDLNGFGAEVMYDFGTKTAKGQTYALDAVARYKGYGFNVSGGYQTQKGVANKNDANNGNRVTFNVDDAFQSGGDTGAKQEFYFVQGNWKIVNSGFQVRAGYKHNKWTDENGSITGLKNFKAENDQFLVAGSYDFMQKHQVALGWQSIVNNKYNGHKSTDAFGRHIDDGDFDSNQIFGQYTYALSKQTVSYAQVRYQMFGSDNGRPAVSTSGQFDGVSMTGTDNGSRVMIGTYTSF